MFALLTALVCVHTHLPRLYSACVLDLGVNDAGPGWLGCQSGAVLVVRLRWIYIYLYDVTKGSNGMTRTRGGGETNKANMMSYKAVHSNKYLRKHFKLNISSCAKNGFEATVVHVLFLHQEFISQFIFPSQKLFVN